MTVKERYPFCSRDENPSQGWLRASAVFASAILQPNDFGTVFVYPRAADASPAAS
jgi:hypothetical protein